MNELLHEANVTAHFFKAMHHLKPLVKDKKNSKTHGLLCFNVLKGYSPQNMRIHQKYCYKCVRL